MKKHLTVCRFCPLTFLIIYNFKEDNERKRAFTPRVYNESKVF